VTGLANFVPLFVRVAARDKAGNLSEMSAYAKATPLPDPDLARLPCPAGPGGGAQDPVLLRADQGPFLVRDILVVSRGAALHVAPGRCCACPGAGLAVRGGDLAVYAPPRCRCGSSPRMRARPRAPGPGGAGGRRPRPPCARRNPGRGGGGHGAGLRPVPARGAHLGQRPGRMVLEDGARPVVTCSRLAGNAGMGGLVVQGAGLAPSLTATSFLTTSPSTCRTSRRWSWTSPATGGAEGPPAQVLGPARTAPALDYPPQECP
jgi:hypothetical protein